MKNLTTNLRKIFLYYLVITFVLACSSSESDIEQDDQSLNDIITVNADNLTVTVDENIPNGALVGTVIGTTNNGNVTYNIISQTPENALLISTSTGELRVNDASAFDYEVNKRIAAVVRVSNGAVFEDVIVEININNLTEINAENFLITIDENPEEGFVLGMVQVTTDNRSISYSIASESVSGALNINQNTGELTVGDASIFDYELNASISGTVLALIDGTDEEEVPFEINLNNLNEVSTEDLVVSTDENTPNGTSLGLVIANSDLGGIVYTIASQTPQNALNIDQATGELRVSDETLFDYEQRVSITAVVTVATNDESKNSNITVNLNNVSEITLQNASFSIDENPDSGDVIGTVMATTDEGVLEYIVDNQSLPNAINIDRNTGEVTVSDHILFDYEANTEIRASLFLSNGIQSLHSAIIITINDVPGDNDQILNSLSTSANAYIAAAEGDWVAITAQEYAEVRRRVIGSSAGTSDSFFNSGTDATFQIQDMTIRPSDQFSNTFVQNSYIYAFRYKADSPGPHIGVKVKVGMEENTFLLDYGNALPQHSGAIEHYFVLKGGGPIINFGFRSRGVIGMYTPGIMIPRADNIRRYRFQNGDVTDVPFGFFGVPLYQALRTTVKQW